MTTRRQGLRLLSAAICLTFVAGTSSAQEAGTRKRGVFEGQSNHETSGAAAIVERGGRHFVQLGEDFNLDGAPDPQVALGSGGYDPAALLGELEANSGAQEFAIPASIDVSGYDEIWIWCVEFDVPLGRARLN